MTNNTKVKVEQHSCKLCKFYEYIRTKGHQMFYRCDYFKAIIKMDVNKENDCLVFIPKK